MTRLILTTIFPSFLHEKIEVHISSYLVFNFSWGTMAQHYQDGEESDDGNLLPSREGLRATLADSSMPIL